MRSGLVIPPWHDPDPGIIADCADSSVGQALRILEERGRIASKHSQTHKASACPRFDSAAPNARQS